MTDVVVPSGKQGGSPIERRHPMLVAPAPFPTTPRPETRPSAGERQATWAIILISLALFWYGVGVGVQHLWSLAFG